MGMSIEKHIEQLKKLKTFHNGSYGASINFAIDTMRKYQQIEKILNKDLEEYHPLDRNPIRLSLIREVVEDGSDTNS